MTVCVLPVFLVVMGVYVEYTHTGGCSTLTVSLESLLVEYGEPVELTCSIPTKPSSEYKLGWESQINPVQTDSETSVVWRSSSLTEWEVNGREMFCYLSEPNKDQCKKRVHLSLYKRPDSVKISSESSVWSEGQMMKLKCEIKNVGPLQNLTVQWTRVDQNKNRTVTEMSYGSFIASGEERKSGNVTATLEVLASRDEDGVQYQCAALLNLEQLQQPQVGTSEPLIITVHYKPNITQPSDGGTISVTKGDRLVLNCSAHGNPSPQYSWSSPGNMNLRNSSILIISSVQSENQGQYSCTAYNDKGSDSVTVTVNVLEHPHTMSLSSVSNVWSEGQRMNLECEIKNTGPVQNLTVQWTRVDQNKNRTVTEMSYGNFNTSEKQKGSVDVTATLEVSASRDEDGVQYQCAALLKPEQLQQPQVGTSEPLKITVHYKPTITQPSNGTISVTKGDELVLNCSAHGNPSPQYTWSSPGNMNLINSSILIISSVQSEDEGKYSCTAHNDEGSVSVTVMVNVVVDYKPIIIAICAVVTVVLIIGIPFGYYKHTQYMRRNLASHRHNGNVAHSDMDQSQL